MKIVIDINPPHKTLCEFGYDQCDMYDGYWHKCNAYRKLLGEYTGIEEKGCRGFAVRCPECLKAEMEAKG